MQAVRHSPPYAMELHRAWRIIVPIRGRLSAQVLTEAFATRAAAQEWLASAEGQSAVELERTQIRPAAPLLTSAAAFP
jgi:hypothetical protein